MPRPLTGPRRPRRRGARRLAAGVAGLMLLTAAPGASAATARECKPPGSGKEWSRVAAADAGMDAAAVQEALDRAAADGRAALAVYRHGCLVATDSAASTTRDRRYESWSVAKSVVSLAAGRAMTLGLLSPDDRVGALIPAADARHGAITLRQLLEMSSGLHWNFFRDYAAGREVDRVADALTLPFDHQPGRRFEYAQSAVALAAEMIGRAAGTDFQRFVQRELFGPIGIAPGSWSWRRDAHGNTLGYMGLQMRPADYARLGQLMLDRGAWRGRRLLADAYVTAATRPSQANPGYGWLWWINGGDRFVGPTIQARLTVEGPFVPGAPDDLHAAVGFGDQLIMVVPSLDLVLTRSQAHDMDGARRRGGERGTREAGEDRNPTGSAELRHELVRRLMQAVGYRPVPEPGPFTQKVVARDDGLGIRQSLTEREHLAAARSTPPLPPAGPAVARAVRVAGSYLHPAPVVLRVSRQRAPRVAIACPPAGRRACTGAATLVRSGRPVSQPVPFRIARGRRARIALTPSAGVARRLAAGRAVSATLRVRATATAAPTTTAAKVTLRPGD